MKRAVLSFLAVAILWPGISLAQDLRALARILPQESQAIDRGEDIEIVLALSQAVPFRLSTRTEPYRIIADFREVRWEALGPDFDRAEAITGVATGGVPGAAGWSRIMFELAGPYAIASAEMRTDAATGGARVVLRLAPTDRAGFAVRADQDAAAAPPVARAPDPIEIGGRLQVVLDPGHGGIDPGAEAGGHEEADLMLQFARELREVLIRTGRFDVALTREADAFVPLPTRISLARTAQADAFLSLHADALAEGSARGATIYTLSDTASDAAAAALAERHDRFDLLAGVDLSRSDDVVAGVLMDLARLDTAPRSDALAEALVAAIGAADIRLHPRPRMSAGFSVLKAADFPSVLIEVGFLSSVGDLENILDADWREQMQVAIADGLIAWADADAATRLLMRQ